MRTEGCTYLCSAHGATVLSMHQTAVELVFRKSWPPRCIRVAGLESSSPLIGNVAKTVIAQY